MAYDLTDKSRTRQCVDTDNRDFKNSRQSSLKIVKTDNYDQTALDLSFSHRGLDTCSNKISSYVFFDTESTGLQDAGHQPKITEFCLLAVDRGDLQPDSGQPRVVNKLLVCLNPQRVITPTANMITGLFNDHLENQTPFTSEMVRMVTLFLERLPPPVCLIAHNGNHFDYPLLRSELMQASGSLPESLLCADSLECFREIMSERVAAGMVRDISNMRNDAEQTPSKRRVVCEVQPIGVKKPRKDPSMQEILYSDVNKESATRRLDFEMDEMELRNSKNDNISLQAQTDNITRVVQQHTSDDPIGSRLLLKQSTSVVKRLSFTDDATVELMDNKSTDSGAKDLTFTKSQGFVTSTHNECKFSIDLPTPESSPNSKSSLDTEIATVCGTSAKNSELLNATHPILDSQKTIHYWETDNPDVKTIIQSSSAENSEKSATVDSKDDHYSKLESQSSIPDDDFLVAVHHIENKTRCYERISDMADIQTINNSEHHHSLEETTNTLSHRKVTLSRESKTDPTSSVNIGSDSSVVNAEMSDIPVPVTKYSPLNISPTTSAQMRNENQQRSDDVPQVRHFASSSSSTGKASTTTTKSSPIKTFPTRLSFKLQEIYRRCYGQLPPVSHNAEDDCVTLLKVVKNNSSQFLSWVDTHAIPFNSISPMY